MSWRKVFIISGLGMGLVAFFLFFLSILVSNYFGRMRDDEAVNTYQISFPIMPKGTIPLGGGIETLRKSNPKQLINPLPMTQAIIDRGRQSYLYYCVQCHGPKLDGKATVGQSFYPLPTYLLDPKVQAQRDGELFYKISLGNKRQPPLYATVAAEDRWAIINYLRALAKFSGPPDAKARGVKAQGSKLKGLPLYPALSHLGSRSQINFPPLDKGQLRWGVTDHENGLLRTLFLRILP